jgi:hypothetical protein
LLCERVRATDQGLQGLMQRLDPKSDDYLGDECRKIFDKGWSPKNKTDLDAGRDVANRLARLFNGLNGAVDLHQESLYSQEAGLRPATALEASILREAHRVRDDLYAKYNAVEGIAEADALALTTEELASFYKMYQLAGHDSKSKKLLVPPEFNTKDDAAGVKQAQEGRLSSSID